jgi:hypothetical protein
MTDDFFRKTDGEGMWTSIRWQKSQGMDEKRCSRGTREERVVQLQECGGVEMIDSRSRQTLIRSRMMTKLFDLLHWPKAGQSDSQLQVSILSKSFHLTIGRRVEDQLQVPWHRTMSTVSITELDTITASTNCRPVPRRSRCMSTPPTLPLPKSMRLQIHQLSSRRRRWMGSPLKLYNVSFLVQWHRW